MANRPDLQSPTSSGVISERAERYQRRVRRAQLLQQQEEELESVSATAPCTAKPPELATAQDTAEDERPSSSSGADNTNDPNMKEMLGGCCVCADENGWASNPLVYCDGPDCEVAVHQGCYGILEVPEGEWMCARCLMTPGVNVGVMSRAKVVQSTDPPPEYRLPIQCDLCPFPHGALKPTNVNGWSHIVCALYIPEVRFGDVHSMEPVVLDDVPHERFEKTCYICEEEDNFKYAGYGACMQCNKMGCRKAFHVTCAQLRGLLCEEGAQSKNVKYCGYCETHVVKARNNPQIKCVPRLQVRFAHVRKEPLQPTPPISDPGVPPATSSTQSPGDDSAKLALAASSMFMERLPRQPDHHTALNGATDESPLMNTFSPPLTVSSQSSHAHEATPPLGLTKMDTSAMPSSSQQHAGPKKDFAIPSTSSLGSNGRVTSTTPQMFMSPAGPSTSEIKPDTAVPSTSRNKRTREIKRDNEKVKKPRRGPTKKEMPGPSGLQNFQNGRSSPKPGPSGLSSGSFTAELLKKFAAANIPTSLTAAVAAAATSMAIPATSVAAVVTTASTPSTSAGAQQPSSNLPSTMEELLTRQWSEVAQLLQSLQQLKAENARMEEQYVSLNRKKEHLTALNARLSLSLLAALNTSSSGPVAPVPLTQQPAMSFVSQNSAVTTRPPSRPTVVASAVSQNQPVLTPPSAPVPLPALPSQNASSIVAQHVPLPAPGQTSASFAAQASAVSSSSSAPTKPSLPPAWPAVPPPGIPISLMTIPSSLAMPLPTNTSANLNGTSSATVSQTPHLSVAPPNSALPTASPLSKPPPPQPSAQPQHLQPQHHAVPKLSHTPAPIHHHPPPTPQPQPYPHHAQAQPQVHHQQQSQPQHLPQSVAASFAAPLPINPLAIKREPISTPTLAPTMPANFMAAVQSAHSVAAMNRNAVNLHQVNQQQQAAAAAAAVVALALASPRHSPQVAPSPAHSISEDSLARLRNLAATSLNPAYRHDQQPINRQPTRPAHEHNPMMPQFAMPNPAAAQTLLGKAPPMHAQPNLGNASHQLLAAHQQARFSLQNQASTSASVANSTLGINPSMAMSLSQLISPANAQQNNDLRLSGQAQAQAQAQAAQAQAQAQAHAQAQAQVQAQTQLALATLLQQRLQDPHLLTLLLQQQQQQQQQQRLLNANFLSQFLPGAVPPQGNSQGAPHTGLPPFSQQPK